MANFINRINLLFDEVKQELILVFAITIGIFLFILFFNPFGLNNPNLNNQLLIVAGLGGIIFFMIAVFNVILPAVLPKLFRTVDPDEEPNYIISLINWILCSVAFAFYIRYVGNVMLSMFLVFKSSVVCLTPLIVLWIFQTNRFLRQKVDALDLKNTRLQAALNEQSRNKLPVNTIIESENKSEKIEMPISDLILIQSADNYIELLFREEGQLKKKLLRNTLKNVEDQLKPFPNFIRCHRTTLVNTDSIEKLKRNYAGNLIKIEGFDIEIPVSRQYLLRVKEVTGTA